MDIYFIYRYSMEVDEEKIYTNNISVLFSGLLVVLSARCGLAAWMHWSCTVFGFNSVEELYP
jgi:hypothetical protein